MPHSTKPAAQRARTKIVATVGPACDDETGLAALVAAGADVFRLNMAHGSPADAEVVFDRIRNLGKSLGRPIGILIDLAGPKIRLGELPGGQIQCHRDARLRIIRGESSDSPEELTTTYPSLVDELEVGDEVMLSDGTVSLIVRRHGGDWVECCVNQPGLVRSRQGVNLPGVRLRTAAMSEADRAHAVWAARHGADFVSLSFVRTPDDVRQLRALLDSENSSAMVIAKIEKREALESLEQIVQTADGVMVARGDLGVEIDVARVPVEQKRIITACHRHGRPVIVATQMLDSMQHSLRPTRAEATDVANAIWDGADACMLSGETAIGQYPTAAVEMMNRIMLTTETLYRAGQRPVASVGERNHIHAVTAAVVGGAAEIAVRLRARLVAVMSHTGHTALAMSKQRNFIPVVGISDSQATLRQMALFWGVVPVPGISTDDPTRMLAHLDEWGKRDGCIHTGDRIVVITGDRLIRGAHNVVEVHEVP